ncbi:MAG: hypothetical protein KAU29_05960 [Gammaproteobacteria bacterium]|nr:hypothetical protein [Gammaproteobacteria bacterium]
MKTKYLPPKHKQQGAVLFISLMILLILTLLGVSSLNGSLMEEKMAANAQTSTTIFQSAESAIRTTYHTANVDDASRSSAYESADDDTTVALATTDGTTRSARLFIPANKDIVRCYNNTGSGRAIEIVGNASMRGIQDTNTQGYTICPMRPDS